MKTSFKMVAMLLGIGIFPLCAYAQQKVVIEELLFIMILKKRTFVSY